MVSFPSSFVHLVTILYCSDIVRSKDLSAHFFCFLSILDQELSFLLFSPFFFLSPILWLGTSFFSFCFLPLFDWEFPFFFFLLPRVRIMVSQDFGSRFVEWLDMIHVGVWFGSRIKGMPHIISMTLMQKWWFGNFMQNWSCMHLCGHSSVKLLWSCDARAQDSFPLF